MSQDLGDAGPAKRKAETVLSNPTKRSKTGPPGDDPQAGLPGGAAPVVAPPPAGPVTTPVPAPVVVPPVVTASILPASFAPTVAGYVRDRAGRIVTSVRSVPVGTDEKSAHFTELRKRYDTHPRVDRPFGETTVPARKAAKLPDKAGETSVVAVAEQYELSGLNVTFEGKWMATGRASVPVPMVGRRDLQLLSQFSQLLLNAQHEKGKTDAVSARTAAKAATATAKAAAASSSSSSAKSKPGAAAKAKVKTPTITAKLTQEIEAMVLGDRILISANETWATEFLCSVNLQTLFQLRKSPDAMAAASWKERKERKIADVAAALTLAGAADPLAPGLPAAAKLGIARLVQLETDCEMANGQRDAVRTILKVLTNAANGTKQIVRGGKPADAAAFVTSPAYAGCVIVVAATMDNAGKKALLHAEQSLVLTALLAGHTTASAVAGGKRPCTVCWLTLRLARTCGHDVNFNWHPGGYWDGTTFRGLARIAQKLGYRNAEDLKTELLRICETDDGLIQYVTDLKPSTDRAVLHRSLSDLHDAVSTQRFNTDTLTQSQSQEYHSPGSFSDDELGGASGEEMDGDGDGEGTEDAMPGVETTAAPLPDADRLSAPWREDESDDEFADEMEGAEASEVEPEDEDETAAPATSGFTLELSMLPDLHGATPIPKESIPLGEGTTVFGADEGTNEDLPNASAFCFSATPQTEGVWVQLLDDTIIVTASPGGRPIAVPSTGILLKAGAELQVPPYTLQVAGT